MNKEISLGLCLTLVAIACAITYVLSTSAALEQYNKKMAGVNQREAFHSKYREIDSFVRNNFIGNIDESKLLVKLFDGYMIGIADKYAKYHTPDEYYELMQTNSGSFVTAGMITTPEEGGYVKVIDIYDDSSANEIGILPGDIITAVEGNSILEIGAEKAIKSLSGDEGTRLNITVQRDGIESKHTLIRQRINIITVRGRLLNDVGYISFSGFNDLTANQFNAFVDECISRGAKGFVFDLRGVQGRTVQPIKNILNRLTGAAALATAENKSGNITNIITTDDQQVLDLPIVVLIDKSTSNLAELFAAVLRDFKNAKIVGQLSAGDATMTKTQILRDGSAVTISIAKVKSTGSLSFDGMGVKPDFLVEMSIPKETDINNIENTSDIQIRKAFEVLETMKQKNYTEDLS